MLPCSTSLVRRACGNELLDAATGRRTCLFLVQADSFAKKPEPELRDAAHKRQLPRCACRAVVGFRGARGHGAEPDLLICHVPSANVPRSTGLYHILGTSASVVHGRAVPFAILVGEHIPPALEQALEQRQRCQFAFADTWRCKGRCSDVFDAHVASDGSCAEMQFDNVLATKVCSGTISSRRLRKTYSDTDSTRNLHTTSRKRCSTNPTPRAAMIAGPPAAASCRRLRSAPCLPAVNLGRRRARRAVGLREHPQGLRRGRRCGPGARQRSAPVAAARSAATLHPASSAGRSCPPCLARTTPVPKVLFKCSLNGSTEYQSCHIRLDASAIRMAGRSILHLSTQQRYLQASPDLANNIQGRYAIMSAAHFSTLSSTHGKLDTHGR